MPQWTNQPLRVFHGTDSVSVGAVGQMTGATLGFSINLALCKPFADFGRGFYTTTRLHQAKQWANMRVLRARPVPNLFAVVLSFDLDRNWLAALDALSFVRATGDFWDLVSDCRLGFPPHNRNHASPMFAVPACYDVVLGPVTLWPQKLTIHDCDQLSFHTQNAASALPAPILYAMANQVDPANDLF